MKNKKKSMIVILTALVLTFAVQMTVFAATTYSKKSTTKMSVALAAGTSGASNTVSISFSSVSSGIKADSITISAPLSKHSGNAIVINYFVVEAPDGTTEKVTVASGNSATTTAFSTIDLKGTWKVYAYCTCYSGVTTGYSSSTYYPVQISAKTN